MLPFHRHVKTSLQIKRWKFGVRRQSEAAAALSILETDFPQRRPPNYFKVALMVLWTLEVGLWTSYRIDLLQLVL